MRSTHNPTKQPIVPRLPRRNQLPLVCRGDRASIISFRCFLSAVVVRDSVDLSVGMRIEGENPTTALEKKKTTQEVEKTARWLRGTSGRRRASCSRTRRSSGAPRQRTPLPGFRALLQVLQQWRSGLFERFKNLGYRARGHCTAFGWLERVAKPILPLRTE